MQKRAEGYMTVYLSLTLGVLLTLSLAMIEGIRLNTLQLESLCMADAGMDCVMGEYHRELFRRFNLLAIDSSYGTRYVGVERVTGRLHFYLAQNFNRDAGEKGSGLKDLVYRDFLKLDMKEASIEGIRILSDDKGACFRQQAVEALEDDLGITAVTEVLNWIDTVKAYQLDTRDIEAEKEKANEILQSYQGKEILVGEDETEILDFEDPTVAVEKRRKTGILFQTLGNKELSGKVLNQDVLIGQRLKDNRALQGNLPGEELTTGEKLLEKVAFTEYLMRYLGCFTQGQEGSALDYEVEYVLNGKTADGENLKAVLLRILAMRGAANAVYLFSDKQKTKEAEAAATAISAVLLVPELKEVFQTAIILAWAYAESVYDVKVLVDGGKVPLLKDAKTWHYALANILVDAWDDFLSGGAGSGEKEGLSYQDYLRILLLLMDEDEMTVRAMDMVEADVRQTKGNQAFRLDGCIIEIHSRIAVESGFGYAVEWKAEKKY